MTGKIQKWGNSLAIRIPKSFATEVGIDEGSAVDLLIDEGRLILDPIESSPLALDGLLAGVTNENTHGEIDVGGRAGKELW